VNQRIAVQFVTKLGFQCEAHDDGRKAVDGIIKARQEQRPFHIVLMDVQMPHLDGYNATREIRRHADPVISTVLIIAMTASAIRGDREKCLEAGMNNYLAKPVRQQVLKQMLEGYIGHGEGEVSGACSWTPWVDVDKKTDYQLQGPSGRSLRAINASTGGAETVELVVDSDCWR
jgi:CheY-like chemotaxis protein